MKSDQTGSAGNEAAIDSVREQIVRICLASYEDEIKLFEECDAAVFDQPTRELSIAALQCLFAIARLPHSETSKNVTDASNIQKLGRSEWERITSVLETMVRAEEVDCCAAFEGKTALEAAETVYDQLKLAEKRAGVPGRVIWLGSLIHSKHVPNVDAVHKYEKWDGNDVPAALASDPELFGELSMLCRRSNSVAELSRWVARTPCTDEMREAMTLYLVNVVGPKLKSRRSGIEVDIGMLLEASDELGSALAEAMGRERRRRH